jgi:hypothetical protein
VASLTATATCTAFRAVEEPTGELVQGRLLAERVGFLTALIVELATAVVEAHWSDSDLARLEVGIGPDGRPLPAKGWMAMRRLGWRVVVPEGVYVSDRVRRVSEEVAAQALRLAAHRRAVVHAILETWPADGVRRTDAEWAALRERLPRMTRTAEIRNRTQQIHAFKANHNGVLPALLTELEAAPRTSGVVLLAAADKQLVTIQRTDPNNAVLRVQLPLTARPAAPTHGVWHAIHLRVPEHVPACARLCTPTLRVIGGSVRVDLPWRISAPSVPGTGHTVALGLDWGVKTLLTGTIGKLADTPTGMRVVTDGRMLKFAAAGVASKLHRLRRNRVQVAARRDHYARLLDGLPDDAPDRAALTAKHAVSEVEHHRICARIRRLNHALAWAAARWAVDQAQALGATVIHVEDLATLQARGRRKGNARLSGQIRGTVVQAVRHLAVKAGIATVTVPARGTSRFCPRCGKPLHHAPAPDRAGEHGWRWAVCSRCGLSGNRDHAAAERIVARGLLAQAHVRPGPESGQYTIATIIDGNVGRARRPTHRTRQAQRTNHTPAVRRPTASPPETHTPTPKRLTTRPASKMTFRRVPDRRTVPAPATVVAGKRPAGQAPQIHHRRPAVAGSGSAYDLLLSSGPPRPGSGWGFHRNVSATPILRLGDFGPATARYAPPATPEALRCIQEVSDATRLAPVGVRSDVALGETPA